MHIDTLCISCVHFTVVPCLFLDKSQNPIQIKLNMNMSEILGQEIVICAA